MCALITYNNGKKAEAVEQQKAIAIWNALQATHEPSSAIQAAYLDTVANVYLGSGVGVPESYRISRQHIHESAADKPNSGLVG